jgi:mono/diheme cytochrome c family protein
MPGTPSYPYLATNADGVPTDGPFPTSGEALREVLARGQERFNIYCSMCHGQTGDGNGMIVQRGFVRPPSYHIDRLRTAPVGHFYQVITNGYGAMYSYGDRIPPADRWAIVAYIRTLQASAAMPVDSLPKDQRDDILKAASAGAAEDAMTPAAPPAATDTSTSAPAANAPTTGPSQPGGM